MTTIGLAETWKKDFKRFLVPGSGSRFRFHIPVPGSDCRSYGPRTVNRNVEPRNVEPRNRNSEPVTLNQLKGTKMREARGRSSSASSGGRGGRDGDKKDDKKRTLFRRRKVCKFCAYKIDDINYKDVKLLGPFVPERGKILPRRISWTCATHQRKLQTAIKRARQLALIPYVTE